ncbi:MAG: D-alanyl-D-alanine carboxypeptidase [Gammaproteobacteria bacterium]|nr:D-alanyl-D-alanine carboxypeptidase [Gammaproteobacteria bacterium]
MKRLIPFLLTAFFSTQAFANPNAFSLVPAPPKLNAEAYLLIDYHSNQVLAEENADMRIEPASLTKMMTSYAVFYELKNGTVKLEDMAKVSTKAWRTAQGTSTMFLRERQEVSIEDLLSGLIIQSGNDASVVLAEHIAGSEEAFASLMNEHARNLGMTGTHFVNSTGLPDPEHYTTARDLAILAKALIHDYPEFYHLHAEKKFSFNGIDQYNRNRLLWRDRFVDGIKTGHTESAGYCLVASAERNNMRLISVVTGTDNENARAVESQKLLRYGYRFFSTYHIYDSSTELYKMRVWKGEKEEVPLGIDQPLYVTIPRGQYKKLKAKLNVDQDIEAPVTKGGQYGTVNVTLGGNELLNRPLVALEDIGEGSMWTVVKDSVLQMFQ